MISIKDLKVSFGKNVVLDNMSFDFPLNEVHGIVGLNGSGKTTFFNTLSTIIKPDSGKILFNERKIKLSDLNYLETINFFYSRITGNEYLNFFEQTNTDFNLASLQQFLELPLDELIETYSTGMKKKLALLAILKKDKPVYLFDEPFNGVDMETNKIIELIILAQKQKGKTVFISSHILDPLIKVCDKIFFLDNGHFSRSFERSDFNKIENELFGDLKFKAAKIISESV
ncbi:MAG: ATP-binding cassette domain-containing protein [bacterium]|nr:ATP-binding cassette domain-containing protein [bacterium]